MESVIVTIHLYLFHCTQPSLYFLLLVIFIIEWVHLHSGYNNFGYFVSLADC